MNYFDDTYTKTLKESDISIELPEIENIEDMYLANHGGKLNKNKIETIYAMLKEELKNVNYGDFVSVDEDDIIDEINIHGYYPDYFYNRIPISTLTPKTREMLITMYKQSSNGNNNNDDFKKMLNKVNQLYREYTLDVELDMLIFSGDETISYDMRVSYVEGNGRDRIIDVLNNTSKNKGDNVVYIQGYVYIYDEEGMYETYSIDSTYLIDEELMAEYDDICSKYN